MEMNFGENNTDSRKNRHLLGLLAGLGLGLVFGALLAGLSILIKSEITALVLLGVVLVGYVVTRFIPNKSAMGVITGALACGFMYFSYCVVLGLAGYWYEDGNVTFWVMLAFSVIYGGVMGFKGKKGFDEA